MGLFIWTICGVINVQVHNNLTVEAVKFLMETEFPDAPADILADTSSQEEKRKVRI